MSSLSSWKVAKAEKGLYAGFVGSELAVKVAQPAWKLAVFWGVWVVL